MEPGPAPRWETPTGWYTRSSVPEARSARSAATFPTQKTELLFLALFLRLMQTGDRTAVIVPDGVLFGSSKAHKTLRRMLVEDQRLNAIISMPSAVFKPYAGVSTAILLFTKTSPLGHFGTGGTDEVWFCDMQADGYSLDDKCRPAYFTAHPGTSYALGNCLCCD